MKTPVSNQEEKIDLIEHINQDHSDEVLTIVQAYGNCTNASHAVLSNLYEEGAEVIVHFGDTEEKHFFPFQIQGDIEEKLLYLAYAAMAKQGLSLSDGRRQFFEITQTEKVTPNLLRLTIQSDNPLPENAPAYAYGFLLKTLEKAPKVNQANPSNQATKKSYAKKMIDQFLLWIMKQLSSQRRQKMIQAMNKGIRYYTLQKSWKSDKNKEYADCGYIDVFLHGETAGSLWADSLKIGDIITTRVEMSDKHENLQQGKALLVADETAYPALLGLLQNWKNPEKPHVIIISEKAEEQAYFTEADLLSETKTYRIVCPPSEQGERVLEIIEKLNDIDTAWGALEKDAAKAIRFYLRQQRHIQGNDNRIKAYWAIS